MSLLRLNRPARGFAPALAIFCLAVLGRPAARGEEPAVEKPSASAEKPAPVVADPQRRQADVTRKDELSFQQAKVVAEMGELEERMFRLSEALKTLEPENSSRLMIGLKYAREELILHQMKEVQAELERLKLGNAGAGQKQLLAKLQRLEQLLMSSDLDFQMKLERLRMIREILKQLDSAILEEEREEQDSHRAAELEQQLAALQERKASLGELIDQQKTHVAVSRRELNREAGTRSGELRSSADGREATPAAGAAEAGAASTPGAGPEAAAPSGASPADPSASVSSTPPADDVPRGNPEANPIAPAAAQLATRDGVQELPESTPLLEEAAAQMTDAAASLDKQETAAALPAQETALAKLEEELARLSAEQAALEAELSQERFAAMRNDQEQNRQTTERITDMVRDLGDAGAASLGELIRAGGSMSNAEGQLTSRRAGPASGQQGEAVASLKYAREQLQQAAEELLDQLRGEVKKRVLEGLTEMLERQESIRGSTESLGPRLGTGSRTALTAIVALARSEETIVNTAAELAGLVEETDFGIALPAALRVIEEQAADVQAALAAGRGDAPVIAAEKQIEEDIAALLEAMKEMPTKLGDRRADSNSQQSRQREINRLLAELKMIRILQMRVNRDTLGVDKERPPEGDSIPAPLEQKISAVQGRQEDVYDVTDRLSIERGEELLR